MKIAFLMAAFLLVAGALAYAENSSLPSSSASGKSLGVERFVPALEARAQYITCRVDYQVSVLEGLSSLSPSTNLSDSVAKLEAAKGGLVESASAGNLSVFNEYVQSTVEPAMRSAANLSRGARKEIITSNVTNASGIASMYKEAKKTRIECENNAREHAKDLAKMALRERVEAAKQKIEAARERVRARIEEAKDNLEALRERLRERERLGNSTNQSKDKGQNRNQTEYENEAGGDNSSGNGQGKGKN